MPTPHKITSNVEALALALALAIAAPTDAQHDEAFRLALTIVPLVNDEQVEVAKKRALAIAEALRAESEA